MKVNNTNPFAPASRVEKTKATRRVDPASAAPGPSAVSEVDVVSSDFMGIPADEMTPKVQKAIGTLLKEVEQLRLELRSAQSRLADLERLADTDTLAPVANRRAFVRELSKSISYAKRHNISASLLYFDVNDLKKVNDQMGHAAGDKVLSHVANTLLINLRESDVVGRLGGDEFAALLMQATEEQALDKGTQLVRLIAETPVNISGKMVNVRVAFGAYTFDDIDDPGDALDQADRRMYQHKKSMKAEQRAGD
ncbi:MAG: GGDEF domain-containing protein [Pseudomonadota bacterium]